MRSRLTLVILWLLLATAACGGSSGRPSGSSAAATRPPEGLVSRVLSGTLELEVSGAFQGRWSGETPINVLTNVGGSTPAEFWQLTVGVLPRDVLELENGLTMRPAFDLIGYDGDGSYTIDPSREGGLTDEELEEFREGSENVEQQPASGLQSAVTFMISETGGSEFTNFNVPEATCSIETTDAGHEGSIECPTVSNGTDTVSFSWSWDADPNEVIEDFSPSARTRTTQPPEAPSRDTPGTQGEERPTTTSPDDGATPTRVEDSDDDGIDAPWKLEVEIQPQGCATRGTPVTVAVDTIPDASITLVLAFSDAQTYGSTSVGQTGPTGDFNWAFNVSADAPDGPADLLVNVHANETNEEHDGSGGGILRAFEVKSQC